MGAQAFIIKKQAFSVLEAYTNAVEDAIEEYGNDGYNGTISTTHGVVDITDQFRKSNFNLMKFINEKLETAEKRSCYAILKEKGRINENKIKSTVEHIITKGTAKWELRYNVYTGMDDRQLNSFKTKGEAIHCARGYTDRTRNTTFIRMEKVLLDKSPNVAVIKYKPGKEKPAEYILFGMAAE